MSKRGPKIGDAVSLWNFAPSPGFTKEEVVVLKYCLMYYGVGRWVQILDTGLLPGKLIQQLNGQTQRLLGQQSLAAYTGLCVDLDRIRKDNDKKEGERKGGLLINSGPNPTKALRAKWQAEAKETYGLSDEERQHYKQLLDDFKQERDSQKIEENLTSTATLQVDTLDKKALITLLGKLRTNLRSLHERWEQSEGSNGKGADPSPKGEENLVADTTNAAQIKRKQRGDVQAEETAAAAPREGTDSEETESEKENEPQPPRRGKRGSKKSVEIALHLGTKRSKLKLHKKAKLSPGRSEEESSQALQSILAMGFNKAMALDALKETNYVLQDAVNWLMANCVGV